MASASPGRGGRSGAGLAADAGHRDRRGVGRDPPSRCSGRPTAARPFVRGGLWDHPHGRSGTPLRRSGVHTVVPDPATRRASPSHVDGRCLSHGGRGTSWDPQTSASRPLLPRPLAGVRAVRAQGRLAPRPAERSTPRTITVSTGPTTAVTRGRRSLTGCRATSFPDRGCTPPSPTRVRVPSGRRLRQDARGLRRGVALRRRRGEGLDWRDLGKGRPRPLLRGP